MYFKASEFNLNGVSLPDLRAVAVNIQSSRQVLVKDFNVIAAVQVVVDEHLPVALHVVHHLTDPRQSGHGIGVKIADLVLDAVPDVIERQSLKIFVRLKRLKT